jgi:hypothetical protein
MGAGEDKRERATRIANSSDTPARIDVHWLTSEAIGAWNKVAALEAEVERLRAENERLEGVIIRAGQRARRALDAVREIDSQVGIRS